MASGNRTTVDNRLPVGWSVFTASVRNASTYFSINALKKAEVDVLGMIAIFSYGFDIAVENFKNANIKLNTLSNYKNLLALAKETNYISSQEHEVLKLWNSNPNEWGK
ncbi:MAG: hypothetical protein ACPHZB_04220 [Flavobacteriales bacterium]